jgi:hypothetical protein
LGMSPDGEIAIPIVGILPKAFDLSIGETVPERRPNPWSGQFHLIMFLLGLSPIRLIEISVAYQAS